MPRVRRPARRGPGLPPWGKTECLLCATPVRLAFLEPDATPVEVGMKPAPLGDRRVSIVAVVMDERLVAREIPRTGFRIQPGETVWIRHADVCPELPHIEQLALPTEEDR